MESKNILIVDDSRDFCESLSTFLTESKLSEKFDIQCDLALSLKEALAPLNDQKYNLIILDIMLPDGVGTEFLGVIRKNLVNHKTPVIILSGKLEVNKPSIDDSLLLYLDKHVSMDQLLRNIAIFLK